MESSVDLNSTLRSTGLGSDKAGDAGGSPAAAVDGPASGLVFSSLNFLFNK
jgi:hypothetical protein